MEKPIRPSTAGNESVKVVVRCRPLSEKEKIEGYDEIVTTYQDKRAVRVVGPKGERSFTFDAVYGADADNATVYDEVVRPLVQSVVEGYNACVFAYGQTGTGKTHTMEGSPEDEGLIPRTFRHVWGHIEGTASPHVTHLVSCSYIELYMEEIRDLLSDDTKKLDIKGQELNGLYLSCMKSVVVSSSAEMWRLLRNGRRRRASGQTDMNEHSSRSHALFIVTVETAHTDTNTIRVGKLNLVDLAGSERQRKSGAVGSRLKEAARINSSLSALGQVVWALAEKAPHIPYRDSRLTRLLQDSLGGNSKTLMLATLSPAHANAQETLTTLRYAQRAKAIKNKPIRNEDPKDAKLREYRAEIDRLKAMIERRKRESAVREREESGEGDSSRLEESVEEERQRAIALEEEVRQLQERLVVGGGGGGGDELVAHLQQRESEIERCAREIEQQREREALARARLEAVEESANAVEETFVSLSQEVQHKSGRLKRVVARYSSLRQSIDIERERHEEQRRDLDHLHAALGASLRRSLLLADSFIPARPEQQLANERDISPLRVRPVSDPSVRRPCVSDGPKNYHNLLKLSPMPLPHTCRLYANHVKTNTANNAHSNHQVERKIKKDSSMSSARPSRPNTSHYRLGTAGVR